MIQIRLSEVATDRKINKSQLSLQAKVGLGVVRRYWDSDTTSVDLNVLDKFCEALNCRPCDLNDRVDNASAN
jgi:DNA-binding Xre family transcriptional regulator